MFKPAQKSQSKLRCAMHGPSGGGKTMSALRIATGIAEVLKTKIAFIDTERGSAQKYADRFTFDVENLTDHTIAGYTKAMKEAAAAGYGVLIIDSMSHAWQELLTEVDRLAQAKFRGNTWSAWSEGTPKQRQFIDTLLAYPGHVIATMRSDTAWESEKDERTGKTKPVKIGLKPQQGKGIEYEFDLLIELSPDHIASVTKDRTGKFQDKTIDKPGEDFGRDLIGWLNDGAAPELMPEPQQRSQEKELNALIEKHNINDQTIMGWYVHFGVRQMVELSDKQIDGIINAVKSKYETATPQAA